MQICIKAACERRSDFMMGPAARASRTFPAAFGKSHDDFVKPGLNGIR
jgi:hypothetical protein